MLVRLFGFNHTCGKISGKRIRGIFPDMKDISKYYKDLYGDRYDKDDMDRRYESLLKRHEELFGVKEDDTMLFSTAGRTELAGNHTDHNLGLVIAGTINLDTIAAVSYRDDSKVIVNSEGFPEVVVDIEDLEVREAEKNTTHALLRGIARAFKDRGLRIGGWQANTTTRVLKGSGLSSSAAIEVLCAEIFNNLFNKDALPPVELAKISQYAENVYFGKPSGLMDQIGCAQGGVVGIDFRDNRNPVLTPIDIDFEKFGYDLVIVDTKGNHADLTGEYAAVPNEMKEVAAFFGASCLREVDYEEFIDRLPELRTAIGNDRAILRAIHFFNENLRVENMLECLKDDDIEGYLFYVEESGNSSFKYLQNVYPAINVKEQGLSLALALTDDYLDGDGVCRVHGGGFAGTIQAYIPQNLTEDYSDFMDSIFGEGSTTVLAIRKRPTCRLI